MASAARSSEARKAACRPTTSHFLPGSPLPGGGPFCCLRRRRRRRLCTCGGGGGGGGGGAACTCGGGGGGGGSLHLRRWRRRWRCLHLRRWRRWRRWRRLRRRRRWRRRCLHLRRRRCSLLRLRRRPLRGRCSCGGGGTFGPAAAPEAGRRTAGRRPGGGWITTFGWPCGGGAPGGAPGRRRHREADLRSGGGRRDLAGRGGPPGAAPWRRLASRPRLSPWPAVHPALAPAVVRAAAGLPPPAPFWSG